MFLILTAIIVAAVLSVVLVGFGEDGYQARHALAEIAGILIGICAGGCALFYAFMVLGWVAADHKAQIINREYGTSYTQAEVFYASDVIEIVRQLDRNRYEINGDLVREKGERNELRRAD